MLGEQKDLFSTDSPSNRKPDLLEGLNPPQQRAVLHTDGPILVLAGAGSGKTRVLTHRVANLILNHNVWPSRILAVTFTNKAAGEMRHRLFSLLGERASQIWISTFHSAALRILRHNAHHLKYTQQFAIYDDQDTKGIIKQIVKDMAINEERYTPDSFSRAIDTFKNNFILPSEAGKHAKDIRSDLQAQVYDRYQRLLMQSDAMDFGDLLLNCVRILRDVPEVLSYYRHALHYLLVDEFQDTNMVQYMFIRLLAEPRRNLFVVGDDDQSIYGFRGANISNILEFERDFKGTEVVKLEQNYRSTATILNAAHAVIEKNRSRKPKKLWTSGVQGDPIRIYIGHDENAEATFIASELKKLHGAGLEYSKMALLYRTNAQTRALEEALVRDGIPYRIFGGLKFFDRKEIKDILAYLRLLSNPADNQAFQRIVNTPTRGIGTQALQNVIDTANRDAVSYMLAARSIAAEHKGIRGFVTLIDDLLKDMRERSLSELISSIITKSEYGPKLAAMKDPTAFSRLENLQELEALGRSMQKTQEPPEHTIKGFLDRIALTSGSDIATNESVAENANKGELGSAKDKGQEQPDTVSLMTLHLAKGLEFPVVFLCGMEDGLLPHQRAIESDSDIEEERRLCYVGVTRAMKILYLTRAFYRGMFGNGGPGGSGIRKVSRFANDIDPSSLQGVGDNPADGSSFFDGYTQYSSIEDEDSYNISDEDLAAGSSFSRWGRRGGGRGDTARSQVRGGELSLNRIRSLLSPADTMQGSGAKVSKSADGVVNEYRDREPAPLERLSVGVKVVHPSFGVGEVSGVSGSGNAAMVTVKFEQFSEPKKLVFKFARLVMGD